MKRLLIDLDGTVADTHWKALSMGYLQHPVCTWNMTCCLADGVTMHDIWNDTTVFRVAPPIPNAVESVKKLMEHFDVHFVSTPWYTNHESAEAKYEWVERHFGDPTLLTLTHHKEHFSGVALVDDKPDLVGPWRHICYPQPWNDSTAPSWMGGLADRIIENYK